MLMTLSPRLLTVCLTLAGCLLPAAGPARAEEGVKVTVVAILASGEEPPRVDPKLQHIAREIQKNHPKLKTFLLKRTTCMALKVGQKEDFPLVEEQVARLYRERTVDDVTGPFSSVAEEARESFELELARLSTGRLAHLPERDRASVERWARAAFGRLAHVPFRALKRLARDGALPRAEWEGLE